MLQETKIERYLLRNLDVEARSVITVVGNTDQFSMPCVDILHCPNSVNDGSIILESMLLCGGMYLYFVEL